jgi:site-specific DNA recombinase
MATTPGRVLRVLGVIRLSDETDETTSPARQRAIIANWASANGHVMAGWAEDLDVSGKVRPFERPELGPWLVAPERFDVIACWKLDRLSRNVVHFAGLVEWADGHRKTIVSVTEGFDLSTAMGRMFATILSVFAQAELETITERVLASHAKLRQDGRYAGAPLPFGYVAAPRPGGGKTLIQDPVYAAHLRRIVADVSEGVSTAEIARKLNERGVMTWGDRRAEMRREKAQAEGRTIPEPEEPPQRWTADVIQQVVKSPACAGFKVQKTKTEDGRYLRSNELVRDADDNPIMATAEPIVTAAQWRSAVAAMASRASSGERTARTDSLLQGVIICQTCRGNLYHQQMTKQVRGESKIYAYYRCQAQRKGRDCADPVSIAVGVADEQVQDDLMRLLESTEITRTEYDPGEDYAHQIAEARQRLDELEDDYLAGKYSGQEAKARYERLHARQCDKVDSLLALPQRPAAARTVGTGETYGQRWERCDRLERRAFLLEQGFKVMAAKPGHVQDCFQCADPNGYPDHEHFDSFCDVRDEPRVHVHVDLPPTVWTSVTDGSMTIYTPGVPAGARLGSD